MAELLESEDVRNSLVSHCKGFSFVVLGESLILSFEFE
jgi:hypothetical protein